MGIKNKKNMEEPRKAWTNDFEMKLLYDAVNDAVIWRRKTQQNTSYEGNKIK